MLLKERSFCQSNSIDRKSSLQIIRFIATIECYSSSQCKLLKSIFSQKYQKLNLNNYHLMQDCKPQLQGDWSVQQKQHTSLASQTTFWSLNTDFKFLLISTINKPIKLFTIEGRLVFNNGSTVYINIGHQSFVNRFLNEQFDSIKKKIIFTIDQSSETLTFTGKMCNIIDSDSARKFMEMCKDEILARKKCILSVLAIIGVPLDNENALMRKILIEKKKLKNKLEEILKKNNEKEQYEEGSMQVQEQNGGEDNGGVIYFGQGTNYIKESMMQEDNFKAKSIEGGYFTIEQTPYVIKNKTTGKIVSKKLVVKKLKEKRIKQDLNLLTNNQIKMKKQIEIITNIKNKKYLIKYYCDKDSIDNLNEVYMDQYEHSLQEYVHYLGDSLQILHKVNISKQVVDAILTLHQSYVIHRDIKPANILIEDLNTKDNQTNYKVKVIDFAQSYPSYAKGQVYTNIDYACSPPYSPFQCQDKKGFTEKGPMQGVGKKEIDYWSVGITIYEIFFRKLPVSFSRAFMVDITSSWKSELLVAVNQRQKFGFNLVEEIINIICVKTMKFSQEQRMKLTLTKRILESLEVYIQNLLQIVEENA